MTSENMKYSETVTMHVPGELQITPRSVVRIFHDNRISSENDQA